MVLLKVTLVKSLFFPLKGNRTALVSPVPLGRHQKYPAHCSDVLSVSANNVQTVIMESVRLHASLPGSIVGFYRQVFCFCALVWIAAAGSR